MYIVYTGTCTCTCTCMCMNVVDAIHVYMYCTCIYTCTMYIVHVGLCCAVILATCIQCIYYSYCSGRIPQFGFKDEVNMDQLVQLRSLLKPRLAERNVAFSYMPVLIKALSLALQHHPVLNSTVDTDCTAITYRADHNVGVAMDTPLGLIVPNVKRVQVMM